MKNYKDNLLGALYMLRTALNTYNTEIAHNILISGGTDQTEEQMENDICEYLDTLDEVINQSWMLEGNPMLINNNGKKLSK